jgi:hypothetical protein
MQSLSVLRAVAALAPGKSVTVFTAGESYELPPKPKPVTPEPPHPFEAVSKQMLERDAEIRALIKAVAERTDGALNQVKEAVSSVNAGQAEVVKSVNENTEALYQPVKPAYFKDGKLMHAQRVKK